MNTLDTMLEQAVAVARDMVLGEAGLVAVLVALPEHRPPVTLFIESDNREASRSVAEIERLAFLERTGATRWVAVEAAEEFAGGEIVLCTASIEGRTLSAVLEIERGVNGEIVALIDRPVVTGLAYLPDTASVH